MKMTGNPQCSIHRNAPSHLVFYDTAVSRRRSRTISDHISTYIILQGAAHFFFTYVCSIVPTMKTRCTEVLLNQTAT